MSELCKTQALQFKKRCSIDACSLLTSCFDLSRTGLAKVCPAFPAAEAALKRRLDVGSYEVGCALCTLFA